MERERTTNRQGKPREVNRLPGEPTSAEFGQRFKTARLAAGYSGPEAARKLGIAPARICEWESGRMATRVTAVVAAVVALGLDPATVFPELFPEKGQK